jgi:hypothetical protein
MFINVHIHNIKSIFSLYKTAVVFIILFIINILSPILELHCECLHYFLKNIQ